MYVGMDEKEKVRRKIQKNFNREFIYFRRKCEIDKIKRKIRIGIIESRDSAFNA